jgi:hypothetical protein
VRRGHADVPAEQGCHSGVVLPVRVRRGVLRPDVWRNDLRGDTGCCCGLRERCGSFVGAIGGGSLPGDPQGVLLHALRAGKLGSALPLRHHACGHLPTGYGRANGTPLPHLSVRSWVFDWRHLDQFHRANLWSWGCQRHHSVRAGIQLYLSVLTSMRPNAVPSVTAFPLCDAATALV